MTRKFWGILLGAIIVVIIGIIVFLYESGHKYDVLAQDALNSHHFAKAKTDFREAQQRSILFFGRWNNVYNKAVNHYGNFMVKKAKLNFAKGNFKKMQTNLKKVPSDYKNQKEVMQLKTENPLNFKVENSIPPYVKIKKTIPFLFSTSNPALAVVGSDKKNQPLGDGDVYVFVYSPPAHTFKLDYSDSQEASVYHTIVGNLFGKSPRKALVVSNMVDGSGALTGAVVLSVSKNGSDGLTKYLDVEPQPGADFSIKNGKLFDSYSGLKMEYTWNGSEFLGQKIYSQPVTNANTITVHYSISKQGKVSVSTSPFVTINKNQELVLIRDDTNDVSERILLNGNGTIGFVKGKSETFVGKKAGDTSIEIIPNGYDWNNAVEIHVNVN